MVSVDAKSPSVVVVGNVKVVLVVVDCVVDVIEVWVVVNGTKDVHAVRIPSLRHVSSAFAARHVPHVSGQNASKHCWNKDQSR
jgi:hypothetical protein